MATNKYSRQREAILEELSSGSNHPTAEELYISLKPKMPNLSLGTVYRNLNKLSEEGTIIKISPGGADHFDCKTENHYHMYCVKCGKVCDVFVPLISDIEEKAKNFADGKILSHTVIFTGICKDCLH